jgi:hypothetical protein
VKEKKEIYSEVEEILLNQKLFQVQEKVNPPSISSTEI